MFCDADADRQSDQKSGLAEIYLCFAMPMLIVNLM
jgi:hypothetical protein